MTFNFSDNEQELLKLIENRYIRNIKKRTKKKFYSRMIVYALSQMGKNVLEELGVQNVNTNGDDKRFDKLWHKLFVSIVDKEEHSLPVGK